MRQPAVPPVAAALALAPQIRAAGDQIEQERRLPVTLVQALARAGMFRLCIPRALHGEEAEPTTLVRCLEALASADGSAGWCAMIGATSGVVSAYLSDTAAQEIYGQDPDVVTGGVFAPFGSAARVDGGFRVSGRWPFASGCQHCSWLMGGCVVEIDGTPRSRMLLFPATAAQIIDTWSVSGLRGTGSHDIAVTDLFVPASRCVALTTQVPRRRGPLYAFPVFGLLALGIAGVALGIARHAIDALVELAGAKMPTGSRRRLAERSAVQAQVATAEATLRAARALVFDAIGDTWEAAVTTGEISLGDRAALRLAATHATASAAQCVDAMYTAGGGTAIYTTSPLQRCFRDIHVVTQHMMVAAPTYELVGRILLGIDADTTML